jgi:hypothetical protein
MTNLKAKEMILKREDGFPSDYPIKSISEAKRFIKQGAVEVNGVKIFDPNYKNKVGDKIKVGKRWFLTVV